MKFIYKFFVILVFILLVSSCIGNTDDKCKDISCSEHGICTIVDNKTVCSCEEGYFVNELECVVKTDSCIGVLCSGHGECKVDNEGIAQCDCFDNYHSNGLDCVKNTCSDISCAENEKCIEENLISKCICADGYYLNEDTCIIDSCANTICETNETCINNGSKAKCVISSCIDLNCSSNAKCIETESNEAKCVCDEGYFLKNGKCFIDNCVDVTCGINKTCINIDDLKTECICDEGFYLNGDSCNVDYCFHISCGEKQHCVNNQYSQKGECFCNEGLEFDENQVCFETRSKGLYIEVKWDTPSDVDLHFLNPSDQSLNFEEVDFLGESEELNISLESWLKTTNSEWWDTGELGRDCHFSNCRGYVGIDWGVEGQQNNPGLIKSFYPNTGPEVTRIVEPQRGWYRTSVHYYRAAENGTNATIKVYCNGVLKYEKSNFLLSTDYTWLVNSIYWETLEGGRGICHIYDENKMYDEKQGENEEGYKGKLIYNTCDDASICTEDIRGDCRVIENIPTCLCNNGYSGENCDECETDILEPNSLEPFLPKSITNGEFNNLKLCDYDKDVYRLTLTQGNVVNIDLSFTDIDGNIDMELYKSNLEGELVAFANSFTDNESISYTPINSGIYILKVYHAWDAMRELQNYSMEITGISE